MRGFKKMQIVLLAVVVAAAAGLITACQQKQGVSGRLRVYASFVGEAESQTYREKTEEFLSANRGVSVESVAEGFVRVPDVLYASASEASPLASQLATVEEVRAQIPDYAKGFDPSAAPDRYAVPADLEVTALLYDAGRYAESDFTDFSALLRAVIRENVKRSPAQPAKKLTASAVADPGPAFDGWAQAVLLNQLGESLLSVRTVNRIWIENNRAPLADAFNEMKRVYTAAKFSASGDLASEMGEMWRGQRSLAVASASAAAGFYGEGAGAYVEEGGRGVKARPIPTDFGGFVLADYGGGWMISRDCLSDPSRLRLAATFIDAQLTAERTGTERYPLEKEFSALPGRENVRAELPAFSKFDSPDALAACREGIRMLLSGTQTVYSGANIVDAMLAAYEKD